MNGAVASVTTISIPRLVEVDEWLKPFERYWREQAQTLNTVLDEEQ